jgi:ABC-2 type transport system ATP-binding protein
VEGRTEVRWTRNGEHFVHAAEGATRFVRELFAQYGEEIEDLEVRRATLEDSYMALVQRFESGERGFSPAGLAVVS